MQVPPPPPSPPPCPTLSVPPPPHRLQDTGHGCSTQTCSPSGNIALMRTLSEDEHASTEGPPRGAAFTFSSLRGCEQDWNLIPFTTLTRRKAKQNKSPKPYPSLVLVSSSTAKEFQIFQKCEKRSKKENKIRWLKRGTYVRCQTARVQVAVS